MTARQRRMMGVGALIAGVSLAAFFALTAFQKNLLYFYTPTQIVSGEAPKGAVIRAGGLVETGSVQRDGQGLAVRFSISDGSARAGVTYEGILPDLFREGQGVIVVGKLEADGAFHATEVLAKHDENYMPPEVADALKKSGKLTATYKDYQKK
jgi:cytochrome c-type biogenesis protein CcmE